MAESEAWSRDLSPPECPQLTVWFPGVEAAIVGENLNEMWLK